VGKKNVASAGGLHLRSVRTIKCALGVRFNPTEEREKILYTREGMGVTTSGGDNYVTKSKAVLERKMGGSSPLIRVLLQ